MPDPTLSAGLSAEPRYTVAETIAWLQYVIGEHNRLVTIHGDQRFVPSMYIKSTDAGKAAAAVAHLRRLAEVERRVPVEPVLVADDATIEAVERVIWELRLNTRGLHYEYGKPACRLAAKDYAKRLIAIARGGK